MSKYSASLGKLISALNISAKDVALSCNVSPATVSRWLNDKDASIPFDSIAKLSDLFHFSIDDFCKDRLSFFDANFPFYVYTRAPDFNFVDLAGKLTPQEHNLIEGLMEYMIQQRIDAANDLQRAVYHERSKTRAKKL